jgi:hypothetical protein
MNGEHNLLIRLNKSWAKNTIRLVFKCKERPGALRTHYVFLVDIPDIIGFFLHEKHHKLCEENEDEVLTHTHTHTHTYTRFLRSTNLRIRTLN